MRIVSTTLALAFFAIAAHAQQGGAAAQPQRTKDCNLEASDHGLKGDARQKFVNACVKSGDKLAACNKQASDRKLKGDAHRKFLAECVRR